MEKLNEPARQEILRMAADDLSVREALVAEGALAKHGYHPRMEAVHRSNAARLRLLIERHGWPGRSLVGDDGAEAAWLIVQHSIAEPPFMRRCLLLMKQAADEGEVLPWQPAMLEDRIRIFEGKPQIYGSQFGPDGELYPIEDPDQVDDRRRAVGLDSLEARRALLQKQADRERSVFPPDWREAYDKWLRTTGWRR
jgi:hypothetical protein